MKTTISGATTIVSFSYDEIDDLLATVIRDGYLQHDQGREDSRMWRWLEAAVAWRQKQEGDSMDAPQLGVIFRKMFEWRAFVFRGEEISNHSD